MRLFSRKKKNSTPAGFHVLTVKQVRTLTKDAETISFNVPEDLATRFQYLPGQYLTFSVMVNGEELRRSYSICTARNEPLSIGVKRVEGGRVSNYLCNEIQAGSKIRVLPPAGRFVVETDASRSTQYVLFAAGSGITPILSILKSVLQDEPQSSVLLIYGNRSEESIMFRQEIEALQTQHSNRLKVIHTLDIATANWTGKTGRIDRINAIDHIDRNTDQSKTCQFYICGPDAMMREVQAALESRSINNRNIHVEYFTAPVDEAGNKKKLKKGKDNRTKVSEVTMVVNGTAHVIEVGENDIILNRAIEEGVDVSFSCMSGICATCMGKCTSGEVAMEEDFALTEEDREAGYILTCQSHPKSDKVTIVYD